MSSLRALRCALRAARLHPLPSSCFISAVGGVRRASLTTPRVYALLPPPPCVFMSSSTSTSTSREATGVPSEAEAEAYRKSRIYTRTGDTGMTSLYNLERRCKAEDFFMALGTVDEVNSQLGVVREHALLEQNGLEEHIAQVFYSFLLLVLAQLLSLLSSASPLCCSLSAAESAAGHRRPPGHSSDLLLPRAGRADAVRRRGGRHPRALDRQGQRKKTHPDTRPSSRTAVSTSPHPLFLCAALVSTTRSCPS